MNMNKENEMSWFSYIADMWGRITGEEVKYDATGRMKKEWNMGDQLMIQKYGTDIDPKLAKKMEADSIFHKALKKTSAFEGGYSNQTNDKGKETKYGITKKWYPDEDIKNLTKERVNYLLYRDYYKKTNIDKLPDGIRDKVFDNAVNQGQPTAIINLQKAIGVKADGILGSQTLNKINEMGIDEINKGFKHNVINRYREIIEKDPSQKKFKNGWIKRGNSY